MSKRFLVIAVILIAVILSGLVMIFMIATTPVVIDGGGMYQDDATFMWTNEFVGTAIASTATAKAYTVTPTRPR